MLLSNSKYCSWEPGHSRRAGALAVATVAELLLNSDANSMERKEGNSGGGRGEVVVFIRNRRECQGVSSGGVLWKV